MVHGAHQHAQPAPQRAGFFCAALAALVLAASPAGAQVRDSGDYLQRIDRDGDGRVSLDEYQAWMGYGFERMDADRNGTLSADELPGGRGVPVDLADHRAALAAAFARQDADGDGGLDAAELAAPPRRADPPAASEPIRDAADASPRDATSATE